MIGATSFWFHSFFRRRPDERSAQSSSSVRPGTTAAGKTIVTGLLPTIKHTMIERRLGQIADGEMEQIGRLLRRALAL